ncbi:MAG: hypothetical protein LT080_10935 [Thiobacillus sp.]|nr:hypothetical protein [Thiobacillus sp.]
MGEINDGEKKQCEADPFGYLLDGGIQDDILAGRGGHDVLFGEAGIDQLFGEAGNDILLGGDVLWGDSPNAPSARWHYSICNRINRKIIGLPAPTTKVV